MKDKFNLNEKLKVIFVGKTITRLEFSRPEDEANEEGDGRLKFLPFKIKSVRMITDADGDPMIGFYNESGDQLRVYDNEDIIFE